jgi:hypothetical protein
MVWLVVKDEEAAGCLDSANGLGAVRGRSCRHLAAIAEDDRKKTPEWRSSPSGRSSQKNAPGSIARTGGLVAGPGRGGVGPTASANESQDSRIICWPSCLGMIPAAISIATRQQERQSACHRLDRSYIFLENRLRAVTAHILWASRKSGIFLELSDHRGATSAVGHIAPGRPSQWDDQDHSGISAGGKR